MCALVDVQLMSSSKRTGKSPMLISNSLIVGENYLYFVKLTVIKLYSFLCDCFNIL